MAAATVTADNEGFHPSIRTVKLTQTGTTSTYQCPYFSEIVAVFATNTSDDDGEAISWSGTTITVVTVGATDVVDLMIVGRK